LRNNIDEIRWEPGQAKACAAQYNQRSFDFNRLNQGNA
jgi:hypothetical protein